jgi:hypothetical protein
MKKELLEYLLTTHKRDYFFKEEIASAIDIIEELSVPEYIDSYTKQVLWHGFKYFGLDFIDIRNRVKLDTAGTLNRNIVMHIAINEYGCNKREVFLAVGRDRTTFNRFFDNINLVLDGHVPDKTIRMNYNRCLEHMKSKIEP